MVYCYVAWFCAKCLLKYGPGYGVGGMVVKENRNVIEALKVIGKTKIKFAPSLIQPIIEKNRDDILWMEERLGEMLTESMEESSDDIKSEADLLMVDDAVIRELKDIIGYDYLPKEKKSNRVEEVADLVHALRMKVAAKVKNKKGNDEMKLIELAQKIQKDNTKSLGKMNEKKIALIIRKALKEIKGEIGNADEGKIKIPMLGSFSIRMVEKEKEGKKEMIKRIFFRLAKKKKPKKD